jgi:hypothetical protein
MKEGTLSAAAIWMDMVMTTPLMTTQCVVWHVAMQSQYSSHQLMSACKPWRR